MDLKRKQFKTEFAGKTLSMEVSRLADQADAAVLGKYGDTTVLATVVMGRKDIEKDYFPLMVNYEEKHYAAGRILGSRYTRREGKSSDDAVLSGRLIDRTIRPLFNQAMRREVQVVVTILTYDGQNDPDFLGLMAASTALAISQVPWGGPVAGTRLVKLSENDSLIFNPTVSETAGKKLKFDAFVSGTEELLNMIELEGDEAGEKEVVSAFETAQEEIKKLISWQKSIIKEIGKKKAEVSLATPDAALKNRVTTYLSDKLESSVYIADKTEMYESLDKLKKGMKEFLTGAGHDEKALSASEALFEEAINDLVHEKVLSEGKRPDGRKTDQLRELGSEVGILPRVHGSALFIRGNTQSLSVATLGAPGDQQLVETIEFAGKRRFLLHYNFPPYSVGEIGPFRGAGRREIGHGNLAHKALRALIPTQEEFPYTIRLVSEILSSNGSSSMATVCAGSLALMDAGVPIRKPAAGIAMGLMLNEKGDFKVLTDIQGPEDHHGDMDFKAAGTDGGLTAIQMDVKIQGITIEMLSATLEQAKEARLQILKVMTAALPAPRKELSPFAPSIITISIDPERIGELIGPGGKVINGIIDATGATAIDIEDDGKVFITAADQATGKKALEMVQSIMKEYAIGDIVEGPIVKILDFGAIVEFAKGHDGMIHVSELKDGFVKKVEDVVKMGDVVKAKIVKMDNGKVGLSIKQLNK